MQIDSDLIGPVALGAYDKVRGQVERFHKLRP